MNRKKKSAQPVRRVVIRTLVPVITTAQLDQVASLLKRFESLQGEMKQTSERLNASLAVLRGENHPEGWVDIVELRGDGSLQPLDEDA